MLKMHVLQSKHIKLKADEISKLLTKYSISKNQLPKIKNNDQALEGINVVAGDVIKIIRKISGEGELEYYRIVI